MFKTSYQENRALARQQSARRQSMAMTAMFPRQGMRRDNLAAAATFHIVLTAILYPNPDVPMPRVTIPELQAELTLQTTRCQYQRTTLEAKLKQRLAQSRIDIQQFL